MNQNLEVRAKKKNNYTSLQTVAATALCQGLPAGIVVAQKYNYSL